MTSYEEFMIILTIGLLIVSILNLRNKQAASSQGRAGGLLSRCVSPGQGAATSLIGCLVKFIIAS
jgi:hypothetical protein